MRKKKKLSYKQFRSLLNESLINPNLATGPIKIIIESGDANYYENRAIELIYEAKTNDYQSNLKKAITLLVLARLERTNETVIE